MKHREIILLATMVGLAGGCVTSKQSEPGSRAAPVEASQRPGRWIDLSHEFSFDTIYWPTANGFEHTVDFKGMTPKGYFYASYEYKASEHGGTHLDAPIHFAKDRMTTEKIPLEKLIGPGVVIHLVRQVGDEADYQVSSVDLRAWEKTNGRIPDGSIVLLNTGWHRHWPNRKSYLGTDERGPDAVPKLRFPGLAPEAAQWLVDNRNIAAIGIDTASIDYGQSTLFESHRILFAKNIPAFENVTNLGSLPANGTFVVALPMKIKSGSGGPLRIVAQIPTGH